MKSALLTFSALLALWASPAGMAQQSSASQLRVGAAKVDVTIEPGEAPAAMPGRGGPGAAGGPGSPAAPGGRAGQTAPGAPAGRGGPGASTAPQPILDRLYSRAIVINNGQATAALVTVDAGAIQDNMVQTLSQRAEKELGIPAQNIFFTATHTHSSGRSGASYQDKIIRSIKLAKDNLQPARMGYGAGVCYLNVNREIIDPKTHTWWEGPNYDGATDKTVAVIKFETLNGDPIAVYFNYAMHAVITGTTGMISGDAPGAAEKYIEDNFERNNVVALWSTGAEGDQNPIYFNQTFEVRDFQTKAILAKGGRDYSSGIPPMTDLDRANPTVQRIERQQKQMILSMGQILGEEVLHVMRTMERTVQAASISATQTTVTCPGRRRTDQGPRGGAQGTYVDGDPAPIHLSLLKIGDIVLGGVNGEIYSPIGMRFKNESPVKQSIFVSLTNGGGTGYIPNDAAYAAYTFESLGSRFKPGCAESAIVNGLIDLIPQAR
jgi:neutral ceramidase